MRAIQWLLNLALVAVVVMVVAIIGPEVETRFWPVYAKFKILRMDERSDGQGVTVTIELRKFRDCVPQGYAWYAGDFGTYVRQVNVVANSRNPAPSLPLGKTVATFTIEGVSLADVPRLYGETFSRCHPFWSTRSVVFP